MRVVVMILIAIGALCLVGVLPLFNNDLLREYCKENESSRLAQCIETVKRMRLEVLFIFVILPLALAAVIHVGTTTLKKKRG